jgi:F-type H+-transporting ATPase subunit alpha
VKEFEKDFTTVLASQNKEALAALRAGKLDNSVTDVIEKVAKEVAVKYR